MKKIRTCAGTHINSGSSACKIDWSKVKGRIVKTAGPELALELEERGYDWIKAELGE